MTPNSGPFSLQPTLNGSLVSLRPLVEEDFEALYSVGRDPLIWDQHPEPDRYTQEKFTRFFQQAIESHGALAVIDKNTGQIIGSSRYTKYDPAKSSIEIGYTFLARSHWGQGHNREMKRLMLEHAFRFVENAYFYVGDMNLRSQRAMAGIGAVEVGRTPSEVGPYCAIIYRITR